jgi:hypothetical protein
MLMKRFDLLYTTLIAPGKGFTNRFLEYKVPELTLKSKLITIAVGLLFNNGKLRQVVFSGGKTKGEDIMSEAVGMKRYLLGHNRFRDCRYNRIETEMISTNKVHRVTQLLKEGFIRRKEAGVSVIDFFPESYKLRKLFSYYADITVEFISVEEVIGEFGSEKDKEMLRTFEHSRGVYWGTIKDFAVALFLRIAPRAIRLRWVAE